jgi:acetylglutamate kinase
MEIQFDTNEIRLIQRALAFLTTQKVRSANEARANGAQDVMLFEASELNTLLVRLNDESGLIADIAPEQDSDQ